MLFEKDRSAEVFCGNGFPVVIQNILCQNSAMVLNLAGVQSFLVHLHSRLQKTLFYDKAF